jgi:hypothetical protein
MGPSFFIEEEGAARLTQTLGSTSRLPFGAAASNCGHPRSCVESRVIRRISNAASGRAEAGGVGAACGVDAGRLGRWTETFGGAAGRTPANRANAGLWGRRPTGVGTTARAARGANRGGWW